MISAITRVWQCEYKGKNLSRCSKKKKTNEKHFNKIIPNGEPFPTDCYVNVLHLLNAAWRLSIHELVQTSDEDFHEKQTLAAENHGKFFTNKGEEILMEFSGEFSLNAECLVRPRDEKAKKRFKQKHLLASSNIITTCFISF